MNADNMDQPLSLPGNPTLAATQVLQAVAGGVEQGLRATSLDIWGGLIGDRIKQWRQRNLIASLEKTALFLEAKGIRLQDARPLPEGELYSIFEGASKTDTPNIQELWAKLLTNRISSDSSSPFFNTIVSTLSSMSEIDALLLKFVSEEEDNFHATSNRAFQTLRNAESTYVIAPTQEQLALRDQAESEAKAIRRQFIDQITPKIESQGLGDSQQRAMAKVNLINLGLLIKDFGDPPSFRDPRRGGIDSDSPHVMIENIGNQLEEISDYLAGTKESRFEPIWVLTENRIALNFEVTDLGQHILGEVGA